MVAVEFLFMVDTFRGGRGYARIGRRDSGNDYLHLGHEFSQIGERDFFFICIYWRSSF